MQARSQAPGKELPKASPAKGRGIPSRLAGDAFGNSLPGAWLLACMIVDQADFAHVVVPDDRQYLVCIADVHAVVGQQDELRDAGLFRGQVYEANGIF